MTTVLAYADGERVWMVGDSLTNVMDHQLAGAARKIVRLSCSGGVDVLVGISGNAGMRGRIRAAWPEDMVVPAANEPFQLLEWAEDTAGLLTQAMVDSNMLDAEGRMDGHFLLAVHGRVWTVYHHAAIPHDNGRAAVGTGEGPALAVLGVLLEQGVAPGRAIVLAAEAAIELDMWSGKPLQIEILQGSPAT